MKGIDTFTEPFEGLKPQSVIFGVLLGVLSVLGYRRIR